MPSKVIVAGVCTWVFAYGHGFLEAHEWNDRVGDFYGVVRNAAFWIGLFLLSFGLIAKMIATQEQKEESARPRGGRPSARRSRHRLHRRSPAAAESSETSPSLISPDELVAGCEQVVEGLHRRRRSGHRGEA